MVVGTDAKPKDEFVVSPFTLVVDSREQAPWSFIAIRSDAKDNGVPVLVRTETRGLPTGDYSIAGCESEIAIERKSLEDLYGTLGSGRRRFQAEFERMAKMRYAAVLVEASVQDVLHRPPRHSRLSPKTVLRTALSWSIRYPTVHWWFAPGRAAAEVMCYRLLERFWQLKQSNEL